MVFSSISFAFADTTTTEPVTTEAAAAISADAQSCITLGMLQGSDKGVTSEYLAGQSTRLQAAIMVLRLKGLEAEALAFVGEKNFADMATYAWAGGKNAAAYLLAHPELGYVGDGVNFNADQKIDEASYYKVMLTALGYKQTTPEVVGDYAWADVLAFAKSIGLAPQSSVGLTNNDIARITVEALKAKNKDGKVLVDVLVAAGVLTAEKVAAAGIVVVAPVAGTVDYVKAVANNKVQVVFTDAASKNAADYKIVENGTTTVLEVKAVEVENETSVVLETAVQVAGKVYALEVAGQKVNFTALTKQTAALEIDTVKCIDTNTVELIFKKAVDLATATDVANYTLNNGATVKSAEVWYDQDDTRKTVKLTTEGVANNKVYRLKIANVKSSDLIAIKTVEKSFTGVTDTKAPEIEGSLVVKNNQRIILMVKDAHGVDEAMAEDVANWSIKSGTDELVINSIVAKDDNADDYGYYEMIEINTASMTTGVSYTLTINNFTDGSIAKNVATKAVTKTFRAVGVDKAAPKVTTITVSSDTYFEVEFNDTNRLDNTTLTDVNNYTFDKDITVEKVQIIRAAKPDLAIGKTVGVYTNSMEKGKSYKLTIANVADEFGNVMASTTRTVVGTVEDITPPYVKSTTWTDLDEVVLVLNERYDIATAEDPANYVINKDLGAVLKAEISGGSGYTKIFLTTAKQAENTSYTITINGVKDRVGNQMTNAKAYFTSIRDGIDTTRPEIVTMDILNNEEVRVTFDEKVKLATPSVITLLDKDDKAIVGTLTSVGQLLDDETTVVYKASSATMIKDGNMKYQLNTLTNVTDKANNGYAVDTDDRAYFYGMSTDNEAAEINTKEQINAKKFQVIFNEPVIVTANPAGFTATVDVDEDDTNEAESTVTLELNSGYLTYDKDYVFDFSAFTTDYMGKAVLDDDTGATNAKTTIITAYVKDEDGPTIDYVEPIHSTKINVVYNEDLSDAGTYRIYNSEDKLYTDVTIAAAIDADYDNIVNLTLTGKGLIADDVYTLKPYTAAKDIANNKSTIKDVEFSFVASSVVQSNYIKGVYIIDGKTIELVSTVAIDPTKVTLEENKIDLVKAVINKDKKDATPGKTLVITLDEAIREDVEYTVTTNEVGSYVFNGLVTEGGIEINATDVISFSGLTTDNAADYDVEIVRDNKVVQVAAVGNTFDATTALNSFGTEYVVQVYRKGETAILYAKAFTREEIVATSVTLNHGTLAMQVGDAAETLVATIAPANSTQAAVWTVDLPAVATVVNGVVTPVAPGTATVTATVGAQTATCVVTVTAATVYTVNVTGFDPNFLMTVDGTLTTVLPTADYSVFELRVFDALNVAGTTTKMGADTIIAINAAGVFSGTIPATAMGYGFEIYNTATSKVVKPAAELKVGNGI